MTSPSTATERPRRSARAAGRSDIQILRAVAVTGVLLYHLWPNRLPGGFTGVDVFFVISGFLITSHLLRSATGAGVRVGRFWAQRARRLLPLAGVVLLATLAAALLLMPPSSWVASLRGVLASALYVQNWQLAGDAVDYLARDAAPPPTQHFWSLSAEEQFYLAWPVILVAAAAIGVRIARRRGGDDARVRWIRRSAFVALALVLVASLVTSLVLTWTQPSLAYFATTTRAWEFAAGGLLAFGVSSAPRAAPVVGRGLALRGIASWAGYAGIVGSMLLIPDGAPFPGVVALLPVGATLLCIAAGDVGRVWSPTVLGRLRPVTLLGDLSYGVYLWHWPLIVIAPFVVGELTGLGKAAVIVAAVGLAAISKATIEDPFRFGRPWVTPWWRGFVPAGVAMLLVAAASVGGLQVIRAQVPEAPAEAEQPTLEPTATTEPDEPLVPPIAARIEDKAGMYDCFDLSYSVGRSCSYGQEDAAIRVALAGDSHAAVYIPALVQLAERHGWRLTTFVGLSCDDARQDLCADGDTFVDSLVSGGFDAVIVGSWRGSDTTADQLEGYWSVLQDAGLELLPIIDVPQLTPESYACIDASGGDPVAARACTFSRSDGLDRFPDRVGPVARTLGLDPIDPTPELCDEDACQNVIGNIVLYQDLNAHLTRTAVMALVPWLERELLARDPALG